MPYGINLNKPIDYHVASLRFFGAREHHITRICPDDVMVLVYEGILCFNEDGTNYEIHPGEYYIQRRGLQQAGRLASDAPRYLYIHFQAEWGEGPACLPHRGTFDIAAFLPEMQKLHTLYYNRATLAEQNAAFLTLLSMLHAPVQPSGPAHRIARWMEENLTVPVTLSGLSEQFHYSPNHIIVMFRAAYGVTPIEYANNARLRHAMYLLRVTSCPLEDIARESGFRHYSHFYRLFQRWTGQSPTAWRKAQRLHPDAAH